MIGPNNITKAFVRIQPIDFRKGIDSLIGFVNQIMQENARSGEAFVFRNKKGTGVKVLYYDGYSFWLCQRRLSAGVLKNWPRSEDQTLSINMQQFILLLLDGNFQAANLRPVFHKVG